MFEKSNEPRSVLQRRSNISNTLQAGLDGLAVIGIAWGLVMHHIGSLTPQYVIMLLMLMGTTALVYDHYAIYRTNASLTRKALILLKAWTISFLVLLLMAFLAAQSGAFSRLLVAELYVLGYVAQALLHLVVKISHRGLMQHAHQSDKVIIVGQGMLANYLYLKISNNPWLGEQVVGSVRLQEEKSTAPQSEESSVSPSVLGEINDLPALIRQHDIKTVYIVTPLELTGFLEQIYFVLVDMHVSIHWIPDIFSLRLINHSVREIAGIPVLTLSETPLTGLRLLTKSVEDFVLSSLILLVISPLLVLIAVAIKLDSPGPVFFRQNRTGWNGKTFRIWKFRSMHEHQPESDFLKQAEKNDARITRVGSFLRKTSLDELPQLFNVLLGDMSLVGPRPHAVQHDAEYSRRIADYFARHNIKPGITGLAQVRGFRGETKDIDQMTLRIDSDIEYINNWSLWLDLTILLRTTTAFAGKNAY